MLDLKSEIAKFLNGISFAIKQEQTAQGRSALGRTAQSLEIEVDERNGILYGNSAVNTLETGRKSGKVPGGFSQIIKEWMSDKGIFQAETESKKNSIAFLIARKISKEGTLLSRQGGNSGVLSKAITEERITLFERDILSKMGREFTEEFVTTFSK